MKYVFIVFLSLFLLSCTKDNFDVYTIASNKKEIIDPTDPAYGTWYLAKTKNNSSWEILSQSIMGFDEIYEDGFEYVLKLKTVKIDVGESDRFPVEYYLDEIMSKQKTDSVIP